MCEKYRFKTRMLDFEELTYDCNRWNPLLLVESVSKDEVPVTERYAVVHRYLMDKAWELGFPVPFAGEGPFSDQKYALVHENPTAIILSIPLGDHFQKLAQWAKDVYRAEWKGKKTERVVTVMSAWRK